MSSIARDSDRKSKKQKICHSDNNFKHSEEDQVKSSRAMSSSQSSSESSTDNDEEDVMHKSDSEYIPDTSDSDNSSVTSTSNEGYLRVGENFQPSVSHSNSVQNHTSKYLKVGVTPESIKANLKNNIEQSEIVNHKKVDLSENISKNVEDVSLSSQSNNKSNTEQSKILQDKSNSPQNTQLSMQENLNLYNNSDSIGTSQNNSQQPLEINTLDDADKNSNLTQFKNCDLNPNTFSIVVQEKVKERMQLKLKEEFVNVIRRDNEKIKLSLLRKMKEMTRKNFLSCLMHLELIPSYYKCPKCDKNMALVKGCESSDNYFWTCRIFGHNGVPDYHARRSVRTGSVFQKSKLPIEEILILFHCWLYKMPYQWIFLELGKSGKNAVIAYLKICRNICTEICAKDDTRVGGDGKVVEISGKVFENYLHKTLEFKWIFFGIEDVCTDKYFFRIFDKCDQQNFLETVKSAVLPGTTIVSEFCSTYFDCVKDLESLYTFKSLADASLKDSSWKDVIDQLPRRKKTNNFDSHIGEYAWRRKNSHVHDKMKKFLSDIKIVFPLQTKDHD